MPDWSIHIAANAAGVKFLKLPEPRWFIAGAVLPDVISRIVYAMLDLAPEALRPDDRWSHLSSEMYHTPMMCLLLAFLISIFTKDLLRTALFLFAGSLIHFFLDALQYSYAGGSLLLYPFSMKQFSFQMLPWDHPAVFTAAYISIIALFFAAGFSKLPPLWPSIKRPGLRGWAAAIVLAAVCFIIPVLTQNRAYAANVNSLRFVFEPQYYEGSTAALSYSRVINSSPLKLEECGREIPVTIEGKSFALNTWLSVTGKYQNGVILVSRYTVHSPAAKAGFSLAGAFLLFLYCFFPGYLRRRNRA